MAIAHGSLTVIDYTDSATYIYYAKTDGGVGVETIYDPNLGLEYIGFYNGPSLGASQPGKDDFPSDPATAWGSYWSGWIKYVGPAGTSCYEEVYYARSSSGEHPPVVLNDGSNNEPFQLLYDAEVGDVLDYKQGATYALTLIGDVLTSANDTQDWEIAWSSDYTLSGHPEIWTSYVPETSEGKIWLWTKHVRTYPEAGRSDIWYNVTKDGEPGNGITKIEEYYCLTTTKTCDTPTGEDLDDAQTNILQGEAIEKMWYPVPPTTTPTLKYLWNCERIIYTHLPAVITKPALIGVHGADGANLQVRYQASSEPLTEVGDIENWSTTVPSTTDEDQRIYMTQKVGDSEPWSKPIQISGLKGRPGEDGLLIEFIYFLTNEPKTREDWEGEYAPSDPKEVAPGGNLQVNVWTNSPQGITLDYKYEYMSSRTKPAAEGQFLPYSFPVLWSRWGDSGLDADSVDYYFQASNSDTPPGTPQFGDNWLRDWHEDPQPLSNTAPYEYVIKVYTPANTADNPHASAPQLWAKWSEDAQKLEVQYTASALPPGDTAIWVTTMPLPSAGQFIYMRQKMQNETTWSEPIQISTATPVVTNGNWYINGQDTGIAARGESPSIKDGYWYIGDDFTGVSAIGDGAEFAYFRTKDPVTDWTSKLPSETGKLPSPPTQPQDETWYNSPVGITETYKYEYVSTRTITDGSKSTWSLPVLWSKWGEKGSDGDGVIYRFRHSETPLTDFGSEFDEWSDQPEGVSALFPYEYVVQGKVVNKTTTYGTPSLWAKWGADGKGIEIRGVAHLKTGEASDSSIGQKYELYDESGSKITGASQEDAYLVDGYLFVYSGANDEFTCTGKIQGPTGPQGPQGDSVISVVDYYYASNSSDPLALPSTNPIDSKWVPTNLPETNLENRYLWNFEVTLFASGKTMETQPTIIATFSSFIETVYAKADSLSDAQSLAPNYWTDLTSALTQSGALLFMKQKESTQETWSEVIQLTGDQGKVGKDGEGVQFIYYNCPAVPDWGKTYRPNRVGDTYNGYQWKDSPVGVSLELPYEYMSVKTRGVGESFSEKEWSIPVLWAKWGDKGLDGDNVYYYFRATDTPTPSWPEEDWPRWDKEKGENTNTNWVPNPPQLSNENSHIFVSMVKVTNGRATVSAPKLWARWASDGKGVAIKGTAFVKRSASFPGEVYWDGQLGDYEGYLYSDANFQKPYTNPSEGDAYMVDGYLFVYSGQSHIFNCVGQIKGDAGIGIDKIETHYINSDDGVNHPSDNDPKWSTVKPPFEPGKYLWTRLRITYGSSVSTSYSCVFQGLDAQTYLISANKDDVLLVVSNKKATATPDILRIRVQKQTIVGGKYQWVDEILSKNTCSFGYFDREDNFINLFDRESSSKYLHFRNTSKDKIENEGDRFEFYPNEFLNNLNSEEKPFFEPGTGEGPPLNIPFALSYTTPDGREIVKKITLREALTQEQMRSAETATSIMYAVQGSTLRFDANGLRAYGSDFELWNSAPKVTQDMAPMNGKTYYVADEFGRYTKFSDKVFDSETTYYESDYPPERVLYVEQESGNLSIKGNVYAESGYFRGEIDATKATFGSGVIGGFDIKDGALTSQAYDKKELLPSEELDLEQNYVYWDSNEEKYVDLERSYVQITNSALVQGQTYYYYKDGVYEAFIYQGGTSLPDTEIYILAYVKPEGTVYLKQPKLILDGESGTIETTDMTLAGSVTLANQIIFNGYAPTSDTTPVAGKKYYVYVNKKFEEISSDQLNTNQNTTYYEEKDAYIHNPQLHDNVFIEAGNIKIKPSGEATLGNIALDGVNSAIYGPNNTWKITSNHAYFNNITASGKINTAVFNAESVSAVGSTMLFLPSYKVEPGSFEEVDRWNFKIRVDVNIAEKETNLSGQYFWLVKDNNYALCVATGCEEKEVRFTLAAPSSENIAICSEAIALLLIGKTADKPLIFGISSGFVPTADGYVYGRGLTLNTYGNNGLPNLFLGDLAQLADSNSYDWASGYGLYCDNAILKGTLTTTPDGEGRKYAGINTYSKENASIEVDGVLDQSPIIFWAGADGVGSVEDSASFYVTESGTLYSQRGYFTEAVFVDGTIEGAIIKTAKIIGTGKEDKPALTIESTSGGIEFVDARYTAPMRTLRIDHLGIRTRKNPEGEESVIISLTDEQSPTIGVHAHNIETLSEGYPFLRMSRRNIGFVAADGVTLGAKISFDNATIYFQKESDTFATMTAGGTTLYNEVVFSGTKKMRYEPVSQGYNVYIQ